MKERRSNMSARVSPLVSLKQSQNNSPTRMKKFVTKFDVPSIIPSSSAKDIENQSSNIEGQPTDGQTGIYIT